MKNKLGLLLGLFNTVVIAAVLGLFVYTKIIFKRPPITESKERARLLANKNKAAKPPAKSMIITLDPVSANLDPYTDTDGKQKVHYVSLTIAVEIRDEKEESKFDTAKPVVLDRVIQNLGKKKFEDLNQVQGRYVFRSQIIDAANDYLGAPIVTEIYFSDFLLQ
jgi:flagellar basal body-associated protein FliL